MEVGRSLSITLGLSKYIPAFILLPTNSIGFSTKRSTRPVV
ncbi:unnamed protein product [Schistosoma margrebowiei]|uniref:Uncharacterized protein n=1 Tax=Schistosoma margrebowiei TaxID=48269 RepID=A0A183LZC1_9TREM|nr:unnamed protein product [Schistosoma margrebowiei]